MTERQTERKKGKKEGVSGVCVACLYVPTDGSDWKLDQEPKPINN
jgi:hypothetical protein